MITGSFLIEWAIRSSVLIGSGAVLLWLLRVKDPSIRLAACIAVVCGSLAMPLFTAALPKLPVAIPQAPVAARLDRIPQREAFVSRVTTKPAPASGVAAQRIDWSGALAGLYVVVASLLLFRLGMGLLLARRLRLRSRATELTAGGTEVRESPQVASPVTVGLARPVILLPADWREWGPAKLDAVLAHERSHVRRRDPAVQFLSALHRALLWHSPLSWVLHRNVVRLAEDVSDDAAVAVTRDRTSYAEMLLEFMQSGVRVNWHGAAMARYGSADARIHRVLNSTLLSTGVPRGAAALICLLAVPLAYVAAAAMPSRTVRAVSNTSIAAGAMAAVAPEQATASSSRVGHGRSEGALRRYVIVLGDTQSGSWDSSEPASPENLRSRFGNRFAWFRQSGGEYVITDEGVLHEIEQAMEPQKKVNAEQEKVNRLQSAVNELQGKMNGRQNEVNAVQDKVNAQQAVVNAAQATVNRRQDLLNRIHDAGSRESNEAAVKKVEALLKELRATPGASSQEEVNRQQAKVNEEQGRVNELQGKVNAEQGHVNEEQHKVNAEQGKVNVMQARVSAEFNARIQEIFDSAIRRGLTKTGR
ncbi:M56 family metallopeptidase [Paludibaculum fermentans]|uniref:Peptidase M56 domain-containing protein n=1 Tax=Paludibaculum fermentans TaxID=1473598 RepID=A0A7S7NRE2_PALFE|nr:M56 family metallopeptidase [Paludibaculum fermentans]QOY87914.1 hypothetical protein IRI77_35140 [Paludibaculum fermentans]